MYALHVLPPAFGQPSIGAFGVKAMALLRMADQPFEVRPQPNPGKMPKGKLPVLEIGDTLIPDSDTIRDYLETTHGVDFDAGLSPLQRAQSRAVIRMVEEHLYFAIVADRWQWDDQSGPTLDALRAEMPPVIGGMIVGFARRAVVGSLKGQGMGRFSKDEQVARASKDLTAIEGLLGDQLFLFGDRPSAADASVVPMLGSLHSFPLETPLRRALLNRDGLMAYLARGKDALYPV